MTNDIGDEKATEREERQWNLITSQYEMRSAWKTSWLANRQRFLLGQLIDHYRSFPFKPHFEKVQMIISSSLRRKFFLFDNVDLHDNVIIREGF